MAQYDVCNGDADGLFALRQWRLAKPAEAILITGIKRDIALLARVPAAVGDRVTVFDIAVDANNAALERLLKAGAAVTWFDHHAPGVLPEHPQFVHHIDTQPGTCTSMLVDAHLGGRFRAWAVAAAFGDNLPAAAERLGDSLALTPAQRADLQLLGEAVNYNAYGDSEADARIHPAALYRWIAQYASPFDVLVQVPIIRELDELRRDDLTRAQAVPPLRQDEHAVAFELPDAPWSRRVLGAFANTLALADPQRAHAVLKARSDGGYTVSVRAPHATLGGADALAREFGGGGRSAAAGINRLTEEDKSRFLARLAAVKWDYPRG